jgi:rhamnose utilization protein RhaD (predicted bifunctional aldolase and dehydrogenase)
VLHGGGNTSVKTLMSDIVGENARGPLRQGSGWDMGSIEPAGLPAVKHRALCANCGGSTGFPTRDMVNAQRTNLLDASAPIRRSKPCCTPSCPPSFIDHTHAAAGA